MGGATSRRSSHAYVGVKRPHQTGKRETTLREVVSWIGCSLLLPSNFSFMKHVVSMSVSTLTMVVSFLCLQHMFQNDEVCEKAFTRY